LLLCCHLRQHHRGSHGFLLLVLCILKSGRIQNYAAPRFTVP
jgi:hypothetical protein